MPSDAPPGTATRAPAGPPDPPPGAPAGPLDPPPGAPAGPLDPPPGAPAGLRAPPGTPPGRSEAVIDRLHALHPQLIDLSLVRLRRCLDALDNPERRLPPVLHVAGTNGKGSTCAVLRAAGEAAGLRVHAYTSPHLVRFHERIRLAGRLVSERALVSALEEVEARNGGAPITVFEVTTATALLLFSRVPADLLVLEVGLGGRHDATNVVERPAACAVTSVSLDHVEFLGDTLAAIATEKAGIARPGVPLVTGAQAPEALAALSAEAASLGAPLLARGRDWEISEAAGGGLRYEDGRGPLDLPPSALPGPHQRDNAGVAVAMLRAWDPPWAGPAALSGGVSGAIWPARLQRLRGRLAESLPPGWELWLDGGHNPGAGAALAGHLRGWGDRPTHLVVGMKRAKAVGEFLAPLLPLAASFHAVAEPGQHLALAPEAVLAAAGGRGRVGPRVADALAALAAGGGPPARVLICGSLYLAGEVLKLDGTLPG